MQLETLQKANILIVDDNPFNVSLLEQMLQGAGYENLHSISDSREVASIFEQKSFDIILLDLMMPYVDGFEIMANLKEKTEDGDFIPILVLTAKQERETRIKALSAGARDFVSKPFDVMEVLRRVQNLLEIRMMHRRIQSHNKILEQEVAEKTKELKETQMEIVRRLGRAAEYRDNETGLHTVRMSMYAYELGLAYGLDLDTAKLLLAAAPMHDIGKIGIPDNILLKPGPLNAEEWQVMKTHAEIGAEILGSHNSPLLQKAAEVAMTHHEKYDGSGYPKGLKEEEIPINGRIVAIADVFDALTSKRPYKEPWPVEKALNLFVEQSGKHFDPTLVKLFLQIQDKIDAIRVKFKEPEEETETAE